MKANVATHPTTLLAELTYRCPLHCPYCSNPLQMTGARDELTTAEWKRVLSEARELGVLQLGLSGGEPLARPDVEELAAHARSIGLYTTLVTSGVGLTRERAGTLREVGLDEWALCVPDGAAVLHAPGHEWYELHARERHRGEDLVQDRRGQWHYALLDGGQNVLLAES